VTETIQINQIAYELVRSHDMTGILEVVNEVQTDRNSLTKWLLTL